MTTTLTTTSTTPSRALRLHEYGDPLDVLHLEQVQVPQPRPGTVLVRVLAVGLNPADWELCRGFAPSALPRGIGYDVAGVVVAVAPAADDADDDVRRLEAGLSTPVTVGDVVVGAADLTGQHGCGAADLALLTHWTPVPQGLDAVQAATLPMVVQTAAWTLEVMGVGPDTTLLVHGAGGMVGFAAVQIALRSGARVLATAGPTFAKDLEAIGAGVTGHGEGMAARVEKMLAGARLDLVLDASRPNPGIIASLISLTGGDPRRVMTISNHEEARALGARINLDELHPALTPLPDLLARYTALAASREFTIPLAAVYPLPQWRQAVELSLGGAPHGKVVLVPDQQAVEA